MAFSILRKTSHSQCVWLSVYGGYTMRLCPAYLLKPKFSLHYPFQVIRKADHIKKHKSINVEIQCRNYVFQSVQATVSSLSRHFWVATKFPFCNTGMEAQKPSA